MAVTAVLGAQWGDEGKGKIVDYLARDADMVIRFQGGDNAGHTVVNDRGEFRLHLIPSGIFNPDTVCVIGTGVVVNPVSLAGEMRALSEAGVSLDKLVISDRAHLVMPYHIALDRAEEQFRGAKIGTTLRGIGPAYADKAARWGLQVCDLYDRDHFTQRVRSQVDRANRVLSGVYGAPVVSADNIIDEIWETCPLIRPHVADVTSYVWNALERDARILLEGQLGAMRDLDWGAYPYVTSSNPIAGGGAVGAGIPPSRITRVVGVVKAYSTAVGEGPMPTELHDSVGQRLRDVGQEYGVTTGRPRRCGWFDAVAARFSARLSGFTRLAVTKLDVLSNFESVKVCVAYDVDTWEGTKRVTTVPAGFLMGRARPVYEDLPGWGGDISDARSEADLPEAARSYLRRIEHLVGVKIGVVSVGPRRDQTFETD
ncbi:MAG: adenylosuccinate synthase [Firmicutes bacterium]|jgi:adenylosuccinate synthase|nr:adenylosuccinate synthase [Bacillota bacterium]